MCVEGGEWRKWQGYKVNKSKGIYIAGAYVIVNGVLRES